EPRALDRRHQAGLQAWPAGLRTQGQPAQGAGRAGRGDHLDLLRADDRQAGQQEGRGRGSPRLRLVGRPVMSRIGRMPVVIPSGVDVTIAGRDVSVKGPKGTLSMQVAAPIEVSKGDGSITVTRPSDEGEVRALHGLSRSLIANMVTGVTQGY